jgi:hypothetical protein
MEHTSHCLPTYGIWTMHVIIGIRLAFVRCGEPAVLLEYLRMILPCVNYGQCGQPLQISVRDDFTIDGSRWTIVDETDSFDPQLVRQLRSKLGDLRPCDE